MAKLIKALTTGLLSISILSHASQTFNPDEILSPQTLLTDGSHHLQGDTRLKYMIRNFIFGMKGFILGFQ